MRSEAFWSSSHCPWGLFVEAARPFSLSVFFVPAPCLLKTCPKVLPLFGSQLSSHGVAGSLFFFPAGTKASAHVPDGPPPPADPAGAPRRPPAAETPSAAEAPQ